jgi:hypothetical protein
LTLYPIPDMKKRILKLSFYSFLTIGLVYALANGCKKGETVTIPLLISKIATDITDITAAGGGSISSDGGAAITERGLCWSTAINPTVEDCKVSCGAGTGSFNCTISGLNPGTVYYLRAYATNSAGTGYGHDIIFITLAGFARLTTTPVSIINDCSVSTGGTISTDGGTAITRRGVCWGLDANPTITGSNTSDGTGTGTYTSCITGLDPNATYHVRAYACNAAWTSYGNDIIFIIPAPGTLETTAVSAVTDISASAGGNIKANTGAVITARGLCWNVSVNPTVYNSKTIDGTGTGTYTSNITGLCPNMTYHVRAYATFFCGTLYGNDISFNTPPGVPVLTTNPVTEITSSSAYSGGKLVCETINITNRGLCWSTSPHPTTADNTVVLPYFLNNNWFLRITGLTTKTTYYLRAYAINSFGTGYGNEISFTTL